MQPKIVLKIDPELRAQIPQSSEVERQRLEDNLIRNGCRDKIKVWHTPEGDDVVIDGHTRLEICDKHNIPYEIEPLEITDREHAKRASIEFQLGRRNLSDYLKTKLKLLYLKPRLATEAKERQRQAGKTKLVQVSAQARTRDKLAEAAGKSPDYIRKVELIAAHPGVEQKVITGRMTVNAAYLSIQRRKAKAAAAEKVRSFTVSATGPFDVIVADAPWDQKGVPYPTMSIEEITAFMRNDVLPVCAPDAILWFWTTNGFIFDAGRIIDAVGFQYKGLLTWAKDRAGTGLPLRGQTEHCLLATRGDPVFAPANATTRLSGESREHSRKPDSFFELVDRLCPSPRRCEFFARESRAGWVTIGAEDDKF